jgi:threonine/homoserine/homoserine lactone efflux protein
LIGGFDRPFDARWIVWEVAMVTETTLSFLLKGLILGFVIAAPVGPIGVLCIRRSLEDGPQVGLITGLGAATADVIYGCIAAFGLTAISTFLVSQRFWLGFLGGLFLCYLGIRTFVSKPTDGRVEGQGKGRFSAYLSTFFLTVTNPMTILSFTAVFAGLGLGTTSNYLDATALIAGVFVGSAAWWLLLSSGVGILRSRFSSRSLMFVNRLSGVVIFVLGLYSLSKLIR